VLDVHAPHEPIIGWRDFLLHLITITIGLLIALSLEGLVEWQHHRHLVQDAEASLQTEIHKNANSMPDVLQGLDKEQAALTQDVVVLKEMMQTHKVPEHGQLTVGFAIRRFEGVGWKTAQSTGALSYMPYDRAQEFSDIYNDQSELEASEQVAARDTIVALAPFLNSDYSQVAPSVDQLQMMEGKIEVLQGQLLIVKSFMQGLNDDYTKFLAAHPK
jgi:hypothetical protein